MKSTNRSERRSVFTRNIINQYQLKIETQDQPKIKPRKSQLIRGVGDT